MRGRTLNDAFIILDEAQNSTVEQMKMFLTRLGFNSKMVITGDITQVDLPASRGSGLIEVQSILKSVAGIRFVYFDDQDVVRHPLVSAIIRAYDARARLRRCCQSLRAAASPPQPVLGEASEGAVEAPPINGPLRIDMTDVVVRQHRVALSPARLARTADRALPPWAGRTRTSRC